MFPGLIAQAHEAGPELKEFGSNGCRANIEENWTLEDLDRAVEYGSHPSASTPEAAKLLRAEVLEKVEQGLARLVPWKDLRAQIAAGKLVHTKISTVQ